MTDEQSFPRLPERPADSGRKPSLSDTAVMDLPAIAKRRQRAREQEFLQSQPVVPPKEAAPEPAAVEVEPIEETAQPAVPESQAQAEAAASSEPVVKPVVPPPATPKPANEDAVAATPKPIGPEDPVPGTSTSVLRLQLPRPPKRPAGPPKNEAPSPEEEAAAKAKAEAEKTAMDADEPVDTSTRYLIKTLKGLPKPPGKS